MSVQLFWRNPYVGEAYSKLFLLEFSDISLESRLKTKHDIIQGIDTLTFEELRTMLYESKTFKMEKSEAVLVAKLKSE